MVDNSEENENPPPYQEDAESPVDGGSATDGREIFGDVINFIIHIWLKIRLTKKSFL